MTLSEYAELAQRTASTTTPRQKMGHGCLGLIGEAGEIVDIIKKYNYMGMPTELAKEKLTDEAGDFGWYLVELCKGIGMDFEAVVKMASESHTMNETICEAAVDLVERAADLYYSDADEMREYARQDIDDMVCCWLDLLMLAEIDLQTVMEHNIDKLRKRYPDGFSADRSNARY